MNTESRIAQLRTWDAAYAADAPLVSDAVYDAARDEARRLAPGHPYWREVGSRPRSVWKKVKHDYPMGSLDKVQTREEMAAWLAKVNDPDICDVEKLDGISIRIRWKDGRIVRAVTRGDGEVGEDITPNVLKMEGVRRGDGPSVPLPIGMLYLKDFTGDVRGEITLKKSVFVKYFKEDGYKNCRNAAGGAAKDMKGAKCHLLTIMCYEIRPDSGPLADKASEMRELERLGFITPGWTTYSGALTAGIRYRRYVDGHRASLDYDIDGLVLYINDTDEREALGESNNRPNGVRAFKFPHDSAETTLRDILWQVGASGRITPVARFDAVDLAGATVSQATLHNIGYIYRLSKDGLRVGDVVLASRRNDVIPAVEELVTAGSGEVLGPPLRCPVCDTATGMDGEYLVCSNYAECPAQTEGSIRRWLVKVGVKEFGLALVEVLCRAGMVSEPADIYRLTVDHLAALQVGGKRFGKSAAATALKNLHARKCLPLHVLVGSLGIPLWSRSMVKLLVAAGHDSVFKLQDLTVAELRAIPGVEETKARAFVSGLRDALPKIQALLDAGVTVAHEATGSLKNATVCMTGFRDAAMEAAVEAAGGTVKSSAGKGLTYLVARDSGGTSGKLAAARANGTRVVGVEEMWEMLGGRK